MYEIKPLKQEDIIFVCSLMSEPNNISALHTDIIPFDEWQKSFAEAENDVDEENFIVYKNNIPCGWIKLNGLKSNDTAWISMLVVSEKFKHQGVGKFAIESAFEYLHSKGFNQIGVQTTEDNNAAKNLYMKCGFSIAEIKKFKAKDGTKINSYVMLKTLDSKKYSLVLPDETHEEAYIQMMDKWESVEDSIQPQLLRRYSKSLGANVSYSKWLEWCEDDRTTGSMLSTGVPCTLYFFVDDTGEILGAIEINQKNTHRGHLHTGIAPWHRGKGLGTKMLELALGICRNMSMTSVDIVPYKSNKSAVKTILKNGGILMDEFYEDEKWSQRYTIPL